MANVSAPETTRLEGKAVNEIMLVEANIPYSTGKRAESGKTYHRFMHEGFVFTAPSESDFVKAFESSKLLTVVLAKDSYTRQGADGKDITIETRKLAGFSSMDKDFALAQHSARLRQLERVSAPEFTLDPSTVSALLGASV